MRLLNTLRTRWHSDVKAMTDPIIRFRNEWISVINNEALMKQGLVEKDSPFFVIHKSMPLYNCTEPACSLSRIGRVGDGGYIMVTPFTKGTGDKKIAYSFGISTDVSWDKDMAKRGYDVYMYDHTIDCLPEENQRFHWRNVGVTGGEETSELKKLSTLIKENEHIYYKHMVLKMDVEGVEWDVFSHISEEVLMQFDQIVLEMHDLLEYPHRPDMVEAIKRITKTHGMVHIHPNNYRSADYFGGLITPDVIEATFVLKQNYELFLSEDALPRELDRPNCTKRYDIRLGRWNI